MLKKVLSFLTVLAMLSSMIPSVVMADDVVKEHGTALTDRSSVDVDIRFGVFGDSHVTVKPEWTTADAALDRLMAAYKIIDPDIDGFAMPGDIIYNLGPKQEETPDDKVKYNAVIGEIKEDFPNITTAQLAWAMGNHEVTAGAYANSAEIGNFDNGRTWQEEVADNYRNYQDVFNMHPIHSQVINGYTFVTTAAYDYLNNYVHPDNKSVISEKELMMKELLQAGLDADSTKPVFFITHDGLDKTSIASASTIPTRYSKEFRDFVINNPRIVTITGHYHYPSNDPRCIWQDESTGSTHITVPAVMGMAKTYGAMTDVVSNNSLATQGMFIEVKGNVVTLRRFDFADKKYIGEPIVFTAGEEAVPQYTTTGRLAAKTSTVNRAYFPEGSEITVSNIKSISADITFMDGKKDGESAPGLQDYFPCLYRVVVKNKATGAQVKSTAVLANFMYNTVDTLWFPEDHEYHEYTGMNKTRIPRKVSVTGLERDTTYTVTITPESVLGQVGIPMSTEFKTNSDKTPAQLALTQKFNQNVAFGKAAVAELQDGTTSNWTRVTDGNTALCSEGTVKDGGAITLDLGRAYNINKIVLDVPEQSSAKQYYKLQLSNAPDFAESETVTIQERGGVASLADATEFANGTTFTKSLDSSKAYRYVRYFNTLESGRGKYMHINELEVYADVYMTDVTDGASASASQAYTGHAASKAIDGVVSESGSWWSDWNSKYNYLQINLGKSYPVSMIQVDAGMDEAPTNFDATASRQQWYIYGSNTVASSSERLDSSTITANGYTQLGYVPYLPIYNPNGKEYSLNSTDVSATAEGIAKSVFDHTPYQYITLKHATTAFAAIAEVKVWAINPTMAGASKTDSGIKLSFSEPMNVDTLNAETLKVYNGNDEWLSDLTYTASDDGCCVTVTGDGVEDAVRVEATYSVLAQSGMDIAGNLVRYFENNVDLSDKPVITEKNVNVAKGKTIDGVNIKLEGSTSLAPLVDGDENTSVYMYSNINSANETNVVPSNITVDLEKRYAIDKIELVMDSVNNQGKQCFELQLSNDADFEDYDTVFTAGSYNDINGESGFDGDKLTVKLDGLYDYRYVRIARKAYGWFQAREIAVYADVNYMEISKNASATASHTYSANMAASELVDGLTATPDNGWFTGWNSAGGTILETSPWVVLDLGVEVPVTKINLYAMNMNIANQFGDLDSRRFWNVYGSNQAPETSELNTVANVWPENISITDEKYTKLFTTDIVALPANKGTLDNAYNCAEMTNIWNSGVYNTEGYLSENVTGSYRYITLHKGYSSFGSLGEVQVYTVAPKVNCVRVNGNTITVTFSDAMFPTYLTDEYIKLYDKNDCVVEYTNPTIIDNYTYSFTANIEEGKEYKVVVNKNAKAFSSIPLGVDNVLSFGKSGINADVIAKKLDGDKVTEFANGEEYSFDVTVKTDGAEKAVRAIVAQYNGEIMVNAKAVDITATSDTEAKNVSGFKYQTGNSFKVFVWDVDTLAPCCAFVPLN